jgi:hypothetical protein
MKKKFALIIRGTPREIEFLSILIPKMNRPMDCDIILIIRQVTKDVTSRLNFKEKVFREKKILKSLNNCFLLKLPPIDPNLIKEKFIFPTGPNQREVEMISQLYASFLGVQFLKSSGVKYDYVMNMRTDYVPEYYPWFEGYIKKYLKNNKKIIVDGLATLNYRYPDNLSIPWQGSLSDQFSFSSYEQFLDLWDFENNITKLWTGLNETTIFRSIFYKYNLDHVQSPRRNQSFLKKFFYWNENTSKYPQNILYPGIISKNLKHKIIKDLKNYKNNKKIFFLIKKKIKENWIKKKKPILNNFQQQLLDKI